MILHLCILIYAVYLCTRIALMQVFPKPNVLTTKPGIDAIRSLHILSEAWL